MLYNMFSSTKTSAFSCSDGMQAWFVLFGLSSLRIMVSECCVERSQAWWIMFGLGSKDVVVFHQSMKSIWTHYLRLWFSLLPCILEINASGFVSSPRRLRLVAKRWWHCRLCSTLCRSSGRDARMWSHTSCICYHAYRDSCGWWKLLFQMLWICWKLFQQQLLCITEWRESTMMAYERFIHTEHVHTTTTWKCGISTINSGGGMYFYHL